jgi:RimJ/RimL family protein N-acetyltransferase
LKNKSLSEIEIHKLTKDDATSLSILLRSADKEYSKYFTPFSFDIESINNILNKAIKNVYFGIYVETDLAGFYMLRGFDEGFETPSYGVWISPDFSRIGLAALTLRHCIAVCKLNGIKKVMLKVHPDNLAAKLLYEGWGFVQTGVDHKNRHLIYHKLIGTTS